MSKVTDVEVSAFSECFLFILFKSYVEDYEERFCVQTANIHDRNVHTKILISVQMLSLKNQMSTVVTEHVTFPCWSKALRRCRRAINSLSSVVLHMVGCTESKKKYIQHDIDLGLNVKITIFIFW